MTREEQIFDAAQICDLDCFVAGAEWADAHPQQVWHKYPEDRPKTSCRCLTVNHDGYIEILWYSEMCGKFLHNNDIVIWMEIPEPPKFD